MINAKQHWYDQQGVKTQGKFPLLAHEPEFGTVGEGGSASIRAAADLNLNLEWLGRQQQTQANSTSFLSSQKGTVGAARHAVPVTAAETMQIGSIVTQLHNTEVCHYLHDLDMDINRSLSSLSH